MNQTRRDYEGNGGRGNEATPAISKGDLRKRATAKQMKPKSTQEERGPGHDWRCRFCGSQNLASQGRCPPCGHSYWASL